MTSQSIDDDQQQKIGAINYEVMVHRIRQHGKPCCAPEYLKQDIDYTQKRAEARHTALSPQNTMRPRIVGQTSNTTKKTTSND